jgi:hypothetical protein
MATDTMPRTPGTPRQSPRRGAPPAPGARPARTTLAPEAPEKAKAPRAPRAPEKPRDLKTRPVTAPRHTRPVSPAVGPAAGRRTRPRQPRAPFILLLVGLLGGALVSLLVISTTLAQGSYRITQLQQQDTNLSRQEQVLSQQVAQASSPAQIAAEAAQLGMQQNPDLQFIDLKTGKIIAGKVTQADAALDAPGYTP